MATRPDRSSSSFAIRQEPLHDDHELSGIRRSPRLPQAPPSLVRGREKPAEIDRETLAGCIRGNPKCFHAFVMFYKDRLYRFLRGMCASGAEVDDVAMKTLMKAHQGFPAYVPRADAAPFTWLATIAHRVLIDHHRREHRIARASCALTFEDVCPDPEQDYHLREAQKTLVDALGRLPVEQREVFLLKELGGHKFEEIASIMGSPLGTAKSRYKKAMNRLAVALAEGGSDHDA